MILYCKIGCPYCATVETYADALGIVLEKRNVADKNICTELVALGGKSQVPYLVDKDNGFSGYESEDINAHLAKYYGNQDTPAPSASPRVCPI